MFLLTLLSCFSRSLRALQQNRARSRHPYFLIGLARNHLRIRLNINSAGKKKEALSQFTESPAQLIDFFFFFFFFFLCTGILNAVNSSLV